MPVKNQCKEYQEHSPQWETMRDVACGQDAIHKKSTRYLPKLLEQSQTDYDHYKMRASFYNATWRTIAGMVGMLFRKPPIAKLPAALEEYSDDINLRGCDLDNFAKEVCYEILTVGRVGLLIDYPPARQGPLTMAQAEQVGLRPFIQTYKTESIINWRYARINNVWKLVMVVLKEQFEIIKDEFTSDYEDRYRVLDLDGGNYRQRVFRINDRGEDELLETIYPLKNGAPMSEIQFVILDADGDEDDVDDPPLIDLANVNLSHYRTVADYEHGCHFTGLPTPYICGYIPTNPDQPDKFAIGSQTAWALTNPDAKVGYLEFTGQGLQSLKDNIDRKERQMVVLGARMLAEDKAGVEAFQTLAIRNAGETCILAAIANSISLALEKALKMMADWAGISGEIEYQLNRDYAPVILDAQGLTALVGAWQSGAISDQTLFDSLKRGDVIADDVTFEDEQARKDSAPPPRPVTPPAPAQGNAQAA